MVIKAALKQTGLLLKKWNSIIALGILWGIILIVFFENEREFSGIDILEMYHPVNLLSISVDRTNWNANVLILLSMIYPLLVVLPAGFSLAVEQQSGLDVFVSFRIGNKAYKESRYLAAFLTTFIVFTLPFIIELILNCASFPMQATGTLSSESVYSERYLAWVNNYLFKDLYFYSRYLHGIFGIIMFGIFSGLLGTFTVAISSLIRVKYKVVLFIPVYVLLYASQFINKYSEEINISWTRYAFILDDFKKSQTGWIVALVLLAVINFILLKISEKKDCL